MGQIYGIAGSSGFDMIYYKYEVVFNPLSKNSVNLPRLRVLRVPSGTGQTAYCFSYLPIFEIMKPAITLENIEQFSVPLAECPMKWMFEDNDGELPSAEFTDQIIPLNHDASRFLWNFMMNQRVLGADNGFFKENEEYVSGGKSTEEIKKWLYNRQIPFGNKIFWSNQPGSGFVLTWKMVIKFTEDLFFAQDQILWDKTLNWVLLYDHNEAFSFHRHRLYDIDMEYRLAQERKKIVDDALAAGRQKEKQTRYLKNKFT